MAMGYVPVMTRDRGELIVISGATRGLGRAMALAFAASGRDTVVGCGRSSQNVDALRGLLGPPHRFDAVDVADDGAVAGWAAEVLRTHGPPDRLINNAGLMNNPAPLWEITAAELGALLSVNVAGTANMIRHFARAMIERGRGVIVNFSSGWGRSTSPEVAPYCATKWAVEGLTRALAQELPPGLAAVSLNPGVVDTDMLRQCWGDAAASSPRPEDWAARAAPYIARIGPARNGEALTVPY